jgi:hypothetical protein
LLGEMAAELFFKNIVNRLRHRPPIPNHQFHRNGTRTPVPFSLG